MHFRSFTWKRYNNNWLILFTFLLVWTLTIKRRAISRGNKAPCIFDSTKYVIAICFRILNQALFLPKETLGIYSKNELFWFFSVQQVPKWLTSSVSTKIEGSTPHISPQIKTTIIKKQKCFTLMSHFLCFGNFCNFGNGTKFVNFRVVDVVTKTTVQQSARMLAAEYSGDIQVSPKSSSK